MVGQCSNCALPSMCSPGTAWARMRAGIPGVGWALQRHIGGQEFGWRADSSGSPRSLSLTWLALFVHWKLLLLILQPLYPTCCGGGSAAPLSSPLLMRVSFLLSPGTLKSFPLLFFFYMYLSNTVPWNTYNSVGGFQMTFSGSTSGLLISEALTLSWLVLYMQIIILKSWGGRQKIIIL